MSLFSFKFYCQQGLQVTKLHKALKLNQSAFMKCYIEQNTKLRQQPDISTFEQKLFQIVDQFMLWKDDGKFEIQDGVFGEEKANFMATSTTLRNSPYSERTLLGSNLARKRLVGINPHFWGCYFGSFKATRVKILL